MSDHLEPDFQVDFDPAARQPIPRRGRFDGLAFLGMVLIALVILIATTGALCGGCSFSGHLGSVDPPPTLVQPVRADPLFQYSIPRDQR